MKTLILSTQDVKTLLTMDLTVRAVEDVFRALGRGEGLMPHKIYLSLDAHNGDFRAMPAYLRGAAGLKWVNSHADNPKKHGLPTVMALYILSDPETALPLAILDATQITAYRTGAAGAVASKFLAKKGARTFGLVGCGAQARTLLEAHRVLFPSLEVKAADVSANAAARFVETYGGTVATVQEASACDIVCTSTPSRVPVVQSDWIRPGTHINAMGADAPGKQELEASILKRARLFVDDWDQASESGEVNVPLRSRMLSKDDVQGMLGSVVTGAVPGRLTDQDITVFDSTGLGIQDLAVAQALYEQAKQKSVGQAVEVIIP